jgi:hypothetical protein
MDIGEQQMAQQVRHAFVVTSAINSKFGVFSPAERLTQTLDTIKSIRDRVPTAKIFIMECCGTPLTDEQRTALAKVCNVLIDFSTNADVQAMYDNDNWDVVKNGTEIMCFGNALEMLRDAGEFKDVDRIHKMSGRYILNNLFDPDTYEDTDVKKMFVIGPKYKSQFPIEVTTVPLQYMARLWSWPVELLDDTIEIYRNSFIFFAERVSQGGYVDIEHVLYKFLPQQQVHEIENLGVEGCIAPNGQAIKN